MEASNTDKRAPFIEWAIKGLFGLSLAIFMLGVPAHGATAAASLYKSKCAGCHAADGSGNTPVGKVLKTPSFHSPAVQKASDAELASAIEKGKGKMPAVRGLTAAQVKGLVAYVRQLGKK